MSYIGNEPVVSATRTITEITATAGQTTFTANGGYTVGYIDVIVNGSQLQTSDFTATNGSTVVLNVAAGVGDDVRLVAWGTFNVSSLVSPTYTGTLTGGTGVVNLGSGQFYKDASGNIGIGTASPASRLNVVNNANSTTAITVTNTNGGSSAHANTRYTNSTGTHEFGILSAGYGTYGVLSAGAAYVYAGNNQPIQLAVDNSYIAFGTGTGATERMRITSSGNVCIGTTTPVDKLTIISTTGGSLATQYTYNYGAANYNHRLLPAGGSGVSSYLGNLTGDTSLFAGSYYYGGGLHFSEGVASCGIKVSYSSNQIQFFANSGLTAGGTFTPSLAATITSSGATFGASAGRPVAVDGSGGFVSIAGNSGGWGTGLYALGSSGTNRGGFGFLGSADSLTYYWVGQGYAGTGVYLSYGGTSWASLSDAREKNVLGTVENALDKVSKIRPVYYKYKSDSEEKGRRIGFIAQEVQAVLPEAVTELQRELDNPTEETKRLSLAYTETIPLLLAAIQELNAKVDAQAAEIAVLKGTN